MKLEEQRKQAIERVESIPLSQIKIDVPDSSFFEGLNTAYQEYSRGVENDISRLRSETLNAVKKYLNYEKSMSDTLIGKIKTVYSDQLEKVADRMLKDFTPEVKEHIKSRIRSSEEIREAQNLADLTSFLVSHKAKSISEMSKNITDIGDVESLMRKERTGVSVKDILSSAGVSKIQELIETKFFEDALKTERDVKLAREILKVYEPMTTYKESKPQWYEILLKGVSAAASGFTAGVGSKIR